MGGGSDFIGELTCCGMAWRWCDFVSSFHTEFVPATFSFVFEGNDPPGWLLELPLLSGGGEFGGVEN